MKANWFVCLIVLLSNLPRITNAEDTYWIGVTGDWFNSSNWRYKVPEDGDWAYIDNDGTAEIIADTAEAQGVYVGYSNGNSGNINHIGGTYSANRLFVGNNRGSTGTYNLSETGQVSVSLIQYVGNSGEGVFNQTGGTNSAGWLYVGHGGQGTYNLSGTGQVITNEDQILGCYGTGIFNQSDGTTNSVKKNLILGSEAGSNGRYTISGGTLNTQELRIGYWGKGRFDIDNSTVPIVISKKLFFGIDSTFTAVVNSTIHMTGASLDNWNTDETDLSGLNNLSLVFESGITAGIGTFEVAGQDIGAVMSGFNENFALDLLTLGDNDIGKVQLVDFRDNMLGTEALYVKNLTLGNGSYLDLNGINLYYQNFTDYGATIEYNGGELIQIPEPATLTMLAVAGISFILIFLYRRKK